MTAIFKNKYKDNEVVEHNDVLRIVADETFFSCKGWGLYFDMCQWCLVSNEVFELIEVKA